MSTIDTIRSALRNATTTVERALPELGYNDLLVVTDEAQELFRLLVDAVQARRIPEPKVPRDLGPETPAQDPQITMTPGDAPPNPSS